MKKIYAIGFFAVVLFTGLLDVASTSADPGNEILIIANKSVKTGSLSEQELRAIFLKQKASWPDGSKMVPINANKGSDVRKAFYQKALNMTSNEEEYYWQKEKVKSGVIPPPEFSRTIKAVYRIKGSVGYCYRKDYVKGVVKILMVVK